jgi:hypothetical protein
MRLDRECQLRESRTDIPEPPLNTCQRNLHFHAFADTGKYHEICTQYC